MRTTQRELRSIKSNLRTAEKAREDKAGREKLSWTNALLFATYYKR
jgi:hypothetical protein